MTTYDEHSRAMEAARAAQDEDFFVDLMPEAAQHVIASQYASPQMLQRKMRVGWDLAADLLLELHELAVLGPAREDDSRQVLVDEAGLAGVLAKLAILAGEEDGEIEQDDPPEPPPTVSLVKPRQPPATPPPARQPLGEPPLADPPGEGGELAFRPDDDLATYQTGELVAYEPPPRPVVSAVVRFRQATFRGGLWVVDQPGVYRGLAVTRQIPRATVRLTFATPRGAGRAVMLLRAWLVDTNSTTLMAKHSEAGEGDQYAKVSHGRAELNLAGRRWLGGGVAGFLAVLAMAWWAPTWFAGVFAALVVAGGLVLIPRRRLEELLWGLALVTVAGVVAWHTGPRLATLVPQPPTWLWLAMGGVALLALGWLGRKEDKPLVEMPARGAQKPPPLTAPMAIGALVALGNSKMRDPDFVRVLMDPHRVGPGVQIDLELPSSVTAAWVMENREPLAAALRRSLGTVWPSVGPAHPGHLRLFVSEIPMNEIEQERWPLLAANGPIDIFTPQPLFTDQMGRWVYITLAYASWVIGAMPRMGKTFTVREICLVYGMDVRVKVIVLDGKGTGDLAPLTPIAHKHVRGARVDKPESIEAVRDLVNWLLREMGRRSDVLASLPFEEAPESKVTSELINAHPELDLGPIALGIDETQSFFSYGFRGNKDHKAIREEIRDGVVELMRMGPALGIFVILSTQTVRDSTIPTEAQAVAVYRYGLKMESWEPNDKVLGTGAHRAGITSTIFGFEEKGIGWFKGEGAKPFIARSVVGLDAVATRTVATRARAWRAARGLLTGEAAGDPGVIDAEIVISIAADVEEVMRLHQRGRAQHVELVDWLKELRPEHYADLDVEELSARLRAAGVPIRQVRIDGENRKGVRLSDLQGRASEEDA